MADFFLELEGDEILFKHRRSKKCKRLKIILDQEGFEVVTPWYFIGSVKSFVLKNKKWVLKQYLKRKGFKNLTNFDEKMLFLGKEYKTIIKKRTEGFRISLGKEVFLIETPNLEREYIKKKLINFLKRKSKLLFEKLLIKWDTEQIFNGSLSVRNQKTRWGSASGSGNLNFNYRLIMAPLKIVEYIIVHELCHLREHNHSKNFWSLVFEKMNDYKKCEKWLKKNQHRLKII